MNATKDPHRPASRWLSVLGPVLLSVLPAIIITAVLTAIWPGHLAVWGNLDVVCPPAYDDVRVISDTHYIGPGETSWTFTVACLSPTGAMHEVSQFLLAALDVVAIMIVLTVLLWLWQLMTARTRRLTRAARDRELAEPGELRGLRGY